MLCQSGTLEVESCVQVRQRCYQEQLEPKLLRTTTTVMQKNAVNVPRDEAVYTLAILLGGTVHRGAAKGVILVSDQKTVSDYSSGTITEACPNEALQLMCTSIQ